MTGQRGPFRHFGEKFFSLTEGKNPTRHGAIFLVSTWHALMQSFRLSLKDRQTGETLKVELIPAPNESPFGSKPAARCY
jgi:hypothetical protein